MNGEIAPPSHATSRRTAWAFVCSFGGHAAFIAAVVFLFAAPKLGLFPIGPGVGPNPPADRPDNPPPGNPESPLVIHDVGRLLAGSGPAPTPWPTPLDPKPIVHPNKTPFPTPAATPTPTATKPIVLPDKTPVVTPEPNKTTNPATKVVTATPPPAEPSPPARPTPTPATTPKETAPGGTGPGTGPGTSPDKTSPGGPPSLPEDPIGPAGPGIPGGTGTGGGGGVNTSVALPAAYLADLQSRLQSNFSVPNNLQGMCVVEFKIAPDGTLSAIKIHTSSGFEGLDAIALRAVTVTARVLPFSAYTQVPEIAATVPFHFEAPAAK